MKKGLALLFVIIAILALVCGYGSKTEDGWFTNPDISTWFGGGEKNNAPDNTDNKNQGNDDNQEHKHTFDESKWINDELYHWHTSTCGCDVVGDKALHTYTNGVCVCGYEHGHTYDENGYCNGCDYQHSHTFDRNGICTGCGYEHVHQLTADESIWHSDEIYHWHPCACGCDKYTYNKAEHNYKNGECTVCGDKQSYGGGGGGGR